MVGCFRFPLAGSNAHKARGFHRLLTNLRRSGVSWVRNGAGAPGRVSVLMGSLIKKRRKRMRKKKHKKMLKRTRFQRRAKGK